VPIQVPTRSCGYCDNFKGIYRRTVSLPWCTTMTILAPSSLGRMPGHTLVIPTRHVETFLDLTDEETAQVAIMTRRVATAIRDTFSPNGIHVQQHNGEHWYEGANC